MRTQSTAVQPFRSRIEEAFVICFFTAQVVHVGVLYLLPSPRLGSNIVQCVLPLLSLLLCSFQAYVAEESRDRWRWIQLATAFLIWWVAQVLFLQNLIAKAANPSVPLSDALWLFFALPLLLVALSTVQSSPEDPVSWLDTGQSCTFFLVVFALVYLHAETISLSTAYNIQSLALVFAFAIRFSSTHSDKDRLLYRNLAVFSILYAIGSAVGYAPWSDKLGLGLDLCWTIPFTGFGYLMTRPVPTAQAQARPASGLLASTHLHGISALGLAVMSLLSSAVLARHHFWGGVATLATSFLLFAARTSIREWQLHAAHLQLEHSSLHDPLTGLANRRLLRTELSSRLAAEGVSAEKQTGLLFIDLDRFKTINDALGHAFGDLLLMRVASLLRTAARPEDIVARQGGDEFVVLLEQVDTQAAEAVAGRVIDALRAPLLLEGRTVQVTASIGVVLSGHDSTADSMLQDADCAMYKAKGLGKNRAELFAPHMLATAKRKLELETSLRRTLADEGIDVHYQPIFGLREMSVRGFEALARWSHPVHGVISPADFIPVAEDTGLIVELGRQVLRKACHQCRAWNDRFHTSFRVAVNVSAHQFTNPDFLGDLVTILDESGLKPALLKLEITESVLIGSYHSVEDILTRARAIGIGVCLDDFGTGYSSLSYLLHFPFDVVKIDRSFVRHLDGDPRRSAMVRMILALAATLEKKIIAEGVETDAELAQLRELGCEMVQGFLLSKPLVASAVEKLLESKAMLGNPAWSPVQTSSMQSILQDRKAARAFPLAAGLPRSKGGEIASTV